MTRLYVTDTHPLVFLATGKTNRLGRKAARAFEEARSGLATVVVPATVLQECWYLVEGRHLRLDTTLEVWWRRLSHPFLLLEPLLPEDIFAASTLAWDHRDPFDRLLAAVALRFNAPLLTRDERITDWGGVRTLW